MDWGGSDLEVERGGGQLSTKTVRGPGNSVRGIGPKNFLPQNRPKKPFWALFWGKNFVKNVTKFGTKALEGKLDTFWKVSGTTGVSPDFPGRWEGGGLDPPPAWGGGLAPTKPRELS